MTVPTNAENALLQAKRHLEDRKVGQSYFRDVPLEEFGCIELRKIIEMLGPAGQSPRCTGSDKHQEALVANLRDEVKRISALATVRYRSIAGLKEHIDDQDAKIDKLEGRKVVAKGVVEQITRDQNNIIANLRSNNTYKDQEIDKLRGQASHHLANIKGKAADIARLATAAADWERSFKNLKSEHATKKFEIGDQVRIADNSSFVGRLGKVVSLRPNAYLTVELSKNTRLWIKEKYVELLGDLKAGDRVQLTCDNPQYGGRLGTVSSVKGTSCAVFLDGHKYTALCTTEKLKRVDRATERTATKLFRKGDRVQAIDPNGPYWRKFGMVKAVNGDTIAVYLEDINLPQFFTPEDLALEW